MGQLWPMVGWKEKRAKGSNEMSLLIPALEGLRLRISSPKPAWSLETAYPNESGEKKRGAKNPNDNGTRQSWLAKLPQALSKGSLKVKSLLEFRSDSGLSPQRWLRCYLWAVFPRLTDTSYILRRSLLWGVCMLVMIPRSQSPDVRVCWAWASVVHLDDSSGQLWLRDWSSLLSRSILQVR